VKTLWRRFVTCAFRLLYNELAWLYDPVSWLVSLGRWRRWQQSVWPYLPPGGRVLEVGPGSGHLLVDLAAAGLQPVGLDLSPEMLRLARRRLHKRRLPVPLCRGRAEALPFAAQTFRAAVLTFPTPFVYDPGWLLQLHRVLEQDGRVIVALMATFDRADLLSRFLEWLYGITGQRGPGPDLVPLLDTAGFAASRHTVAVDTTTVHLVVAQRRSTPLPRPGPEPGARSE
jgi:ubiquinone/menaquinone biosynthesis C-methylase UbiE